MLGASGKLGRMLARHWRRTPPAPWQTLWQYRENPPPDGVHWAPGQAVPAGLGPVGAVLALWGVTPAPAHEPPRDLAENSRLAVAAMELAAELGAGRVLHCSSAAVYEPGPGPLGESAAGGALNAYGAAKLAMEGAIAEWCARHPDGPKAVILRIGNVAGADSLFAALARGGPVTLDRFTDGQGPWRSYLSVPGFARALDALLSCPLDARPLTLNLAAPRPLAMEAIARAAGREVDWREAPAGAAPMVWLDTGRLSRIVALPGETAETLVAQWHAAGAGA